MTAASGIPADAPLLWWQSGVIYQIYPRSFQDSNGDGVGDLRGILSRLDYLRDLGVDAIWLSPIYPSPMADFGYDVADYRGVDPLFGTLEDFDDLVAAAHQRGIRVLLDFVPNHSSDRHPWFLDSRASRTSAKRGWYIWRDPAPGGGPPNNWLSHFGGDAWEWDPATEQYYLHSFLKEQPDLNWRHPDVRTAMLDVLRFWFNRGVDGFRIDVLWLVIKDDQFRDDPVNPAWQEGQSSHSRLIALHSADRPEVHDIVAAMRGVADAYDARVLIGEIYLPLERLVAYYGKDLSGAHLPFNFQLLRTRWDAANLARIIREYEAALPPGAWPNWVLGNHDQPRLASRVGPEQARIGAMLLLTLRGTPTLYNGDELGLPDATIPSDAVRDPAEMRQPGLGLGRDPQRSPMVWTGDPHGGFSTAQPWLPLVDRAAAFSVAAQARQANSMLSLYQRLLALRRQEPALVQGAILDIAVDGHVLTYRRILGHRRIRIALNLCDRMAPFPIDGDVLLSTLATTADGEREPQLRPHEGIVMVEH